jgi:quercetin 2,3-dioxygenase
MENANTGSEGITALEELFNGQKPSGSSLETGGAFGCGYDSNRGLPMQTFNETLIWKIVCPGCKKSLAFHLDQISEDEDAEFFIASYFCPPGNWHEFYKGDGLILVLDGELAFEEGGKHCIMKRGDVKSVRSADSAVYQNNSETQCLRFFNVAYKGKSLKKQRQESRHVSDLERRDRLTLIASSDGRLGSVRFNADMDIYWASLSEREQIHHPVGGTSNVWLQVMSGAVEIDGEELGQGRGVIIEEPDLVSLTGQARGTELLLIELPRSEETSAA